MDLTVSNLTRFRRRKIVGLKIQSTSERPTIQSAMAFGSRYADQSPTIPVIAPAARKSPFRPQSPFENLYVELRGDCKSSMPMIEEMQRRYGAVKLDLTDYVPGILAKISLATSLEVLEIVFSVRKSIEIAKEDLLALRSLQRLKTLKICQRGFIGLRSTFWTAQEMTSFFSSFPRIEVLQLGILTNWNLLLLETLSREAPDLRRCLVAGVWDLPPSRNAQMLNFNKVEFLKLGFSSVSKPFRQAFIESAPSRSQRVFENLKYAYEAAFGKDVVQNQLTVPNDLADEAINDFDFYTNLDGSR